MKDKNTRHHIEPRSRRRGAEVTGVCIVPHKIHDLSHQLFGNMKPKEIIVWLNSTLWGDIYEITIKRKKHPQKNPP